MKTETLWVASVQEFIVRVVRCDERLWIEVEGVATIHVPKTAETLAMLIATAGEILARMGESDGSQR